MKYTAFITTIIFCQNALSQVEGFTDFTDCGKVLLVENINFGNCVKPPCVVNDDKVQNINIEMEVMDNIPFESLQIKAYLYQMSIPFEVKISPSNACNAWDCPLEKVNYATFDAVIDFARISLMRPGRLRVLATSSDASPSVNPIFCFEFGVTF